MAGQGFRSAVRVMALSKKRAGQANQSKNPTFIIMDPKVEVGLSACKLLRNLFFWLSRERGVLFLGLACGPSNK